MRYVLGSLMAAAGILHFVQTYFYLKIVPDYLPEPLFLVYASGAAAFVLGLLFFSKRTLRLAGWGTVLFLVAVFPANLHLATHPELLPQVPVWAHWARLPFQAVFILWALRYTRRA